jgi:hypothetical protein
MSAKAQRVFIVYAATDDRTGSVSDLVREIARTGRERIPDFEVFFDRTSLAAGSDLRSVMLQALSDSIAAVVLLSPALLADRGATRELSALIRRREAEPDFRIVPVMLAPADPPGFLKGHLYVDAVEKDPREVAAKIVDAVLGEPVVEKRFQPTRPVEYKELLQAISEAAARDEQTGVREPKH